MALLTLQWPWLSCVSRGGEMRGVVEGYQTRVSEGVGGQFEPKNSTLLRSSPCYTIQSSSPRCVDSLHVRRDERCSGIKPGQGGEGKGRLAVMMAGSRRVHEEKTLPGPALTPHTIKPFCSQQGPLGSLLQTFYIIIILFLCKLNHMNTIIFHNKINTLP